MTSAPRPFVLMMLPGGTPTTFGPFSQSKINHRQETRATEPNSHGLERIVIQREGVLDPVVDVPCRRTFACAASLGGLTGQPAAERVALSMSQPSSTTRESDGWFRDERDARYFLTDQAMVLGGLAGILIPGALGCPLGGC